VSNVEKNQLILLWFNSRPTATDEYLGTSIGRARGRFRLSQADRGGRGDFAGAINGVLLFADRQELRGFPGWSLSALAPQTERLRFLVAVRPGLPIADGSPRA